MDRKKGAMYIFISYAREDVAVAEKVEAFLTEHGFRIFRDTQIPHGADWDKAIGDALRACDRMVLLLSSHSMPERKEVKHEWFYFDQIRKPIYPLYIEDCELHPRFYSYNYIDARESLPEALNKLLTDLGQEVEPRFLPDNLQAALEVIVDATGEIDLSADLAAEIGSITR